MKTLAVILSIGAVLTLCPLVWSYDIYDFQTYGMTFNRAQQQKIEAQTKSLVEAERKAGYFAGTQQEEDVRNKCKKYLAMSLAVYPGLDNDVDRHNACKATSKTLQAWLASQTPISDVSRAKALAAVHYNKDLEIHQMRELGRALKRGEINEEKYRQSAAAWATIRVKHAQIDAVQTKQALEDMKWDCRRRCEKRYGMDNISYYTCCDACQEYALGKE